MIRTVAFVVASLLLVGALYADDQKKNAASEKKPEAKTEAVTTESPESKPQTAAPKRARKKGLRSEAGGHRGRVTKASMENGVIKLSVDGKDYEFTVGDHTHARLRTTEKDGKDVVVGLSLMSGDARRGALRTRPAKKGKAE